MSYSLSRWDFYALGILTGVVILQLSIWPKLPLFMDCYYHLGAMRGFADAGGWVAEAFWEYAPQGRPHLYPPLFHILELSLFKLGAGPMLVARIFDFLIYPLFLAVIWLVLRLLYSKELAFFSLFLLLSSNSLYLAVINNIPFSLAFIFGFLSFYFLERRSLLSASLCLALACYTHSLMSYLILAGLFFYALLDVRYRKSCLLVCFIALLLASPLLWHQFSFRSYISLSRVAEFYYAQLNLLFYLLAALGLFFIIANRDKRYLFFIALSLGFSVLFFTNRNRLVSGHGLIPLALLAAAACEFIYKKLGDAVRKRARLVFFVLLFIIFYICTPFLLFSPFRQNPVLLIESWLSGQMRSRTEQEAAKGETIYYPKFIDEIARLAIKYTKEDEIIFCDFDYAAGMIAALAHRATSCAMLHEVRPAKAFDRIENARLIIWLKDQRGVFPRGLAGTVAKYGLVKVDETQLAYLYLNPKCAAKKKVLPAQVPFAVCAVFLLAAFGGIIAGNSPLLAGGAGRQTSPRQGSTRSGDRRGIAS